MSNLTILLLAGAGTIAVAIGLTLWLAKVGDRHSAGAAEHKRAKAEYKILVAQWDAERAASHARQIETARVTGRARAARVAHAAACAAGTAGYFREHLDDYPDDIPEVPEYRLNPVNGMPMSGDSMIDVTGHVYGVVDVPDYSQHYPD